MVKQAGNGILAEDVTLPIRHNTTLYRGPHKQNGICNYIVLELPL